MDRLKLKMQHTFILAICGIDMSCYFSLPRDICDIISKVKVKVHILAIKEMFG